MHTPIHTPLLYLQLLFDFQLQVLPQTNHYHPHRDLPWSNQSNKEHHQESAFWGEHGYCQLSAVYDLNKIKGNGYLSLFWSFGQFSQLLHPLQTVWRSVCRIYMQKLGLKGLLSPFIIYWLINQSIFSVPWDKRWFSFRCCERTLKLFLVFVSSDGSSCQQMTLPDKN